LSLGGYGQPFQKSPVVVMPSVVRSTVKRLAQKLLGQNDVRSFVRLKRLWLSKQIYRRPIFVAACPLSGVLQTQNRTSREVRKVPQPEVAQLLERDRNSGHPLARSVSR
jgi:hypothetical protein